MREIKFRGKGIADGKWVYGYVFEGRQDTYILCKKAPCEMDTQGLNVFSPIPVIAESVGQHTGFLDKNGTEIYESDILQFQCVRDGTKKTRAVVKYDLECGSWYCGGDLLSTVLFEQNNDGWKISENWLTIGKQYAIIIGNKVDNPELLED